MNLIASWKLYDFSLTLLSVLASASLSNLSSFVDFNGHADEWNEWKHIGRNWN